MNQTTDQNMYATRDDIRFLSDKIDNLFCKLDNKIDNLENKIEKRLNEIENKFESKFNEMENRFESKFNKIDERFNRIEESLRTLNFKVNTLWGAAAFMLGGIIKLLIG